MKEFIHAVIVILICWGFVKLFTEKVYVPIYKASSIYVFPDDFNTYLTIVGILAILSIVYIVLGILLIIVIAFRKWKQK